MVNVEERDVIAALIAGIEKRPARGEFYMPRVVAPGRSFAHVMQSTLAIEGEDGDRIVEAIGGVEKSSVRRQQDLRSEACSSKAGGQSRKCLLGGKQTGRWVEMKKDDRRRFFLERIEPTSIGVKHKVPGPIPRRQRSEWSILRENEPAGGAIERENINPILPQICAQHKAAPRVRQDHVWMRAIVPADCETARRPAGRDLGSNAATIFVDACGWAKLSRGQYGQHRYTATVIVRDKNVLARHVNTQVSGPASFRAHSVQ